jgi:hypothetical protein
VAWQEAADVIAEKHAAAGVILTMVAAGSAAVGLDSPAAFNLIYAVAACHPMVAIPLGGSFAPFAESWL